MPPAGARDGLLFGLLGLIWGSAYLAVEVAGVALGPLTFVAMRLAIGGAVLVAILAVRRERLPSLARMGHVAVVGLTGVALPFTLITWGQRGVDGGLASLFNAATPLFTVLLASLVLADEPLRAGRLVGILVGLAGVVIVVGGGIQGGGAPVSIVALLLAVASYAVTAVYTRRFLRGERPSAVASGQVLTGLAMTAPLALLLERPTLDLPPAETVGALLWLGVVATGIAPLLFFHLIRTWGAARTSVVNYLIPLVGVTTGAVVFGESIGPATVVGGLVVVAGMAVATRASATGLPDGLAADRARVATAAA
jgi:drug/metabolite transporter (DMT)-like permease